MSSSTKTKRGSEVGQTRGAIGLGDLMRALKGLDCSDQTIIERIAHALGFSGIDANPAEQARGVSEAHGRPRIAKKASSKGMPQQGALPEIAPPIDLPDEILETEMMPAATSRAPVARPTWLDQGPALEDAGLAPVRRVKLFPDRSVKGVLSAAVATRRAGPHPDIPRLIRAIVRGRVLNSLPLCSNASLHRGLQLLMDTSEAMTPFLQDLDDLAEALIGMAGRHNCELYEFRGDPSQAARWSADFRETPWRPVPGRPVVIASDLGIGAQTGALDRAEPSAWLHVAARARAAGVPVVAFVPYGRVRWRKTLSRRIQFVHWDPRTRASHITKLFGSGHEVGP